MPIDPDVAIGAHGRRRRRSPGPRATCCSTTSASAPAPARATTSTPTRCATPSTAPACRCCRRSASWRRRSTRPTRRRSTCPAATSTWPRSCTARRRSPCTRRCRRPARRRVRTTLTDVWDKGKAAVIWQEGVATVRRRRGAVDHPVVDLRPRRGRLGRRPRHRPSRSSCPTARPTPTTTYAITPAAGAALPALRRPQPAALRPRLRQGGRLPGADPARAVLLRDRAARAHRRAARRRRRPGSAASRRSSPASSIPARRSGCGAGTRTAGSSVGPPSRPDGERDGRARCSATSSLHARSDEAATSSTKPSGSSTHGK